MKSYKALLIGCALFQTVSCSTVYQQPKVEILEVPFTQVHINDAFWSPRIETNRTISIPSAFKQCELNGRFDNFAVAAGLKKGLQQGDFLFDDTDPYKIIEGASYSLAVKYDKKLDCYLDSVIGLIAAAQEPDGYLCTAVTNKCERLSGWWGHSRWEKINSHELYCCGHLYEAAVAHFQATKKRTLLDVAIKNADLICDVFGPKENQKHVPSGHPIVEMALCKLYKVTGNKNYLQLAKYFVEETGRGTDGHKLSEYSQDHKPILQQDEIVGHAVRAGYLFSGVADVASLTKDTAYFHAIKRIWNNMAGKKLYITGGIGSRAQGEGFGPNYELNNQTAYCETCASIANVYWNYRMFLATGESKYVDVLERALYNGVVSGVSLSGDKFFYDNPLESMGQHERAPWFGCACCPGNITRFMASVPKYMYAVQSNDIYVNLYTQSLSTLNISAGKVEIEQVTDYPWNGKIGVVLKSTPAKKYAIRFRIPGWIQESPVSTDLYSFIQEATPYTIKLNGKSIHGKITDGYFIIVRNWKDGDRIDLNFPMEVRQVKANANVEDDIDKLAIERGPIMYCMEGKDQVNSTVFNKFIPANTAMKASYDGKLLNGVIVLSGFAMEVKQDGSVQKVPFKAIPYSTWDNRGPNEMVMWIPEKKESARITPIHTIASKARTFTIQTNQAQNGAVVQVPMEIAASGVNDQWEPKRSSDISKPYFYWWEKNGTEESLIYHFDDLEKISSVGVYWLDLDQYDGNFRVPESWILYYKTGNEWKAVENTDQYTVKKDCYNVLHFKSVETKELKISARLQKNASGGILEWKVNN